MKYIIHLNDKVYEVEVEKGEAEIIDEYDFVQSKNNSTDIQSTESMQVTSNVSGNGVKSPIPGNILSIKVSEGQKVKAGDVLIIIEAMKMENEVCAPNDGVVKKIFVTMGQTVATGDCLLEI